MSKPYSTVLNYISPRPKPHSTSLPLYTLHIPPRLISPFPTSHLLIFSPLQFHSLHFTVTFQPPFLEILDFPPVLQIPLPHFTSVSTFLTFSPYVPDFPALQNPFTSLHLSYFKPCSCKYSISSSLRIPFSSPHFTYHFHNPLPKYAQFKGEIP